MGSVTLVDPVSGLRMLLGRGSGRPSRRMVDDVGLAKSNTGRPGLRMEIEVLEEKRWSAPCQDGG